MKDNYENVEILDKKESVNLMSQNKKFRVRIKVKPKKIISSKDIE